MWPWWVQNLCALVSPHGCPVTFGLRGGPGSEPPDQELHFSPSSPTQMLCWHDHHKDNWSWWRPRAPPTHHGGRAGRRGPLGSLQRVAPWAPTVRGGSRGCPASWAWKDGKWEASHSTLVGTFLETQLAGTTMVGAMPPPKIHWLKLAVGAAQRDSRNIILSPSLLRIPHGSDMF